MVDEGRQRSHAAGLVHLGYYGLALFLVAVGVAVRVILTRIVGPGLPTYITFYPVVMLAALIGGIGPGILATTAAGLTADYWLLPPVGGLFSFDSRVDLVGLVFFYGVATLMSIVTGLYRRIRGRLDELVAARTAALSQANEQLQRESAERKRAEETLAASEERFRIIATNTPDHLLVQDADLRYELVINPQLGLTEKEMIGKTDHEFLLKEDAIKLTAIKRKVMETGRAEHVQAPLTSKDGSTQYYDGSYIPRYDTQGRVNGLIGYFKNVTERKQAEEAMRESRAKLQAAFGSMTEAVFIADAEGRLIEFNDEFVRYHRFKDRDECSRTIADCPKYLDVWFADGTPAPLDQWAMSRALRGETASGVEYRLRLKETGEIWWGSYSFAPIRDQDGKITGGIVAGSEITERKRAEEELERTRDMLAQAQKIAHLGSFEYIAATRMTVWSEEEFRIYGLDPTGPPPTYDVMLERSIHPDDAALLHETFAKAMQSRSIYELEHRIVRPDGSVRWVYDRAHPHFDDQGNLLRYVGATLDITDQKHVDEQLRKLNRTLEALSDSSHALMRAEEESAYLEEVCKIVVEDCGHMMVWVGYAEEDEARSVRPVAHAGFEEGYLETLRLTWADTERGRGPTGTAIRTARPVRCPNMLTDPRFAPWREQALKRGYASSIALPLLSGDKAFGVLTIYSREPDPFSPDEVQLLEQLAADLTYGITSLRLRAAHAQAAEALRESQENLSTVVRMSPAAIFVTREADGLFLEANEAYVKLIGYPVEEVIGHTVLELNIWADPEDRRKVIDTLRRQGHVENSETRFRRRTGDIADVLYSATSLEQAGERRVLGALMDITERKRAAETLRQREATLSGILKATKESIWLFSPEGVILMGNEMATSRFGEGGERVIGKHFTEVLPPALAQSRLATLGEAVASGRPMESQDERAGMIFRHDWYPIVDDTGRVTSVACFSRDITERKRAEESLQKAHDELEMRVRERTAELHATSLYARSLIEASLDPLVTISTDGKITDVNQATELVTGVAREQLIGSSFSDYFTEPEKANAGYQQVIREGLVRDYPLTIRHVSGRTTDVLYNATVYRNEAGAVQGVFAAARDITEHKRMEGELRTASLYARSLLEASLDPLVTISPDGKVTDVNEATEHATGVSRDRLIGSDFSGYFTEPDKANVGYRKVLDEGLVHDYPLTIRHASGRTTDVLYNATVYRNEAGIVQGVFAAARDVTERKRAEAELARYREHLEELVQERSGQLKTANERLQEQAADLVAINKDLEQFAYIASHDLQEPLRAVGGFTTLLQQRYQGKLDEAGDRYIDLAVDGVKRMQALIEGLLEYSRVGTRGSVPAPTPAADALKGALQNLQMRIQESGAVITSDPLPTVSADVMQLTRLFQNLISNALKFCSERKPEIHIGAQREANAWRLSVRDNGIGIEPQYNERIFLIFQRLHTRTKYPGTGIGLAICKRIVERHGGNIWVESQPGRGSTFYFTLPDRQETHEPTP